MEMPQTVVGPCSSIWALRLQLDIWERLKPELFKLGTLRLMDEDNISSGSVGPLVVTALLIAIKDVVVGS